jgi:hypothetical protein
LIGQRVNASLQKALDVAISRFEAGDITDTSDISCVTYNNTSDISCVTYNNTSDISCVTYNNTSDISCALVLL